MAGLVNAAKNSKVCRGCGQEKSLAEFAKNSSAKSGLSCYCRPCANAQHRAWEQRQPDFKQRKRAMYLNQRERQVARDRERRYGVSEADFARMRLECGDLCSICHQPERRVRADGGRYLLSVDHDHNTGEIRGLLCSPCNAAIGLLEHDPALLRSAIDYLTATAAAEAM